MVDLSPGRDYFKPEVDIQRKVGCRFSLGFKLVPFRPDLCMGLPECYTPLEMSFPTQAILHPAPPTAIINQRNKYIAKFTFSLVYQLNKGKFFSQRLPKADLC